MKRIISAFLILMLALSVQILAAPTVVAAGESAYEAFVENHAVLTAEGIEINIGARENDNNVRCAEIDGVVSEISENGDKFVVTQSEDNLLVEITEKDADGNLVKSQYFYVDVSEGSAIKLSMDSYMHAYDEKSIRTKGFMGIRFKAHIATAQKYEDAEFVVDEYGYVIATKKHLGENELTFDTEKKAVGIAYNKADGTDIVFEADDEKHIFTGVLKNVPVAQYKTDLVCKTYTKLSVNGENFVLYGEAVTGNVYDTATEFFAADNYDIAKIIFDYNLYAGADTASFTNAKLETSAKNGKISVDGSFTNTDSTGKTYNVYLVTYDNDGNIVKIEKSEDKTIASGANTFSATFEIASKEQKTTAFVLTSDFVCICDPFEKTVKSLRLLSIGNSFSIDAQEWLYGIAKDGGIDNVVLGNLYIGGCSLQTHSTNADNNSAAYTYYKNTTGTWTNTASKTMLYGLTDENWDYITLQQASGSSGRPETYDPYLENIIEYVNDNKLNPDAKLLWHMTWAYDESYVATSYYKSQSNMYNSIISTVQNKIVPNEAFSMIIPSGTAVQNARTSHVGDKFNRDGYHLDYTYGRYLAGLTWFHEITGLPIDDIDYIPNGSFSEEYLEILKESAKNAVAKPFEITQSQYTKAPDEKDEFEDYVLIDWEPKNASFYNSTGGSALNEGSELAKRFISSKMFTKETLPVGSVIVVDSGYSYRPEGWVALDQKNTAATRPEGVSINKIVIDEEWWGDFNYRAFNLYKSDNSNIDTIFNEAKTHLKIYVPKSLVDEPDEPESVGGYIDWEPMKDLYYNSLGSSVPSTSDGNKNKFICSKIFTRDELPVGTVIEVDEGYQYRPEGWVDLNSKNTVRPNNVTASRIVIDEEWWGDYNYRAFNLSKTNLSDICTDFDESVTHFRIYVPFSNEIDIPVDELYR